VKKAPAPIKTGPVELTQAAPDGEVTLMHRNKEGRTVQIVIPPKVLERWAIRQLRAEVFA
jgi:hypothetical protein